MAVTKELTWVQFEELRLLMVAIGRAKALRADEGELKNTIVSAEWNKDKVEVTLDF